MERLKALLALATFVILIAVLISALAGCVTFDAAMVRALATDPATAAVSIQSPYGYLRWMRSNPGAGTSVTIDPAGVFTIKREVNQCE